MKTVIPTITIALALVAGSASAMVSQGDLNRVVGSAISSDANVLVTVNGDTATITGYSASGTDIAAANRAALEVEGINSVNNHMFSN